MIVSRSLKWFHFVLLINAHWMKHFMWYPKVVPEIEFSKSSNLNSFDSLPILHKSRFLWELIEAIFPFEIETSIPVLQPCFITKFLLANSVLVCNCGSPEGVFNFVRSQVFVLLAAKIIKWRWNLQYKEKLGPYYLYHCTFCLFNLL